MTLVCLARIPLVKQLSVACLVSLALIAASCGGADAPRQASSAKVVPHETLLEFLPNLTGWSQERAPQGETDTTEGVSRVQVTYAQQGGIGGISIEIMDTSGNNNILGPLREFIKANRTERSGGGAIETTPVQVLGFPGQQEWTPEAKNGTLSVLVADRFTVGITGNSLANADVMKTTAEAIDLKKLASLK